MKIFCCYTSAHKSLLDSYFKPSLSADMELHAQLLDGDEGRGDYMSPEYVDCIHRKIDAVIESLRRYPGEVFIWSDIDIVFFRSVAADLEKLMAESGKDILFQREGAGKPEICGGFYVLRSTEKLRAFFEDVRAGIHADRGTHDQHVMNGLLPTYPNLAWGYLPMAYYARTHGWPPPADIALYHANETMGSDAVGQKIAQFHEVRLIRKYGLPAVAWSCFKKIPKRLKRWIKG